MRGKGKRERTHTPTSKWDTENGGNYFGAHRTEYDGLNCLQ